MPLYGYRCPSCGSSFDRILPLALYAEVQRCGECGARAEKVLSTPAIVKDYPGYECPATGCWIEGRRAHEENLKRTGCRILEPGERQAAERSRKADEAAFEDAVANTAAAAVAAMPAAKKDQLAKELSSGADISVVRQSV